MSAEEVGNLVPTAVSTELEEDAEFRGSREDQEDLLLTAQRYLNIYHQIHIFKAFKRAEFDKQLIAMPDKVRKILAMLPGGRVLLEHMEDVEKNAGIQDSELAELIENQDKDKDKDKDRFISYNSGNAVPTVINAPIEIGSEFKNLLKETFSTYAQNLQQLSANIQKIAAQKTITSADGKVQVMPDMTDTISTLLKENAQQQNEVLKSFGQTLTQALKENRNADIRPDITETISTLLQQNTLQQNEVLKSLGETISQTINSARSEPSQINLTETISTLLKENAQQQNEVLKSFGEMLFQTLAEAKGTPLPATDGSPHPQMQETLASLLKENAQQQTEVLKSLGETLSQTISENKGKTNDADLAETVSSLLRENARQQTEVLKSFGETLSQAILQSQKELVASLLKSQQQEQVVMSRIVERSQTVAIKNQQPAYQTVQQQNSDILPLPINAPHDDVQPITEVANEDKAQIVAPATVAIEKEEAKNTTEKPKPNKEKKNILQAVSEKLSETKNKFTQTAQKSKLTAENSNSDEVQASSEDVLQKTINNANNSELTAQNDKSKKNKKKSDKEKQNKIPNSETETAASDTYLNAQSQEDNSIQDSTSVPTPHNNKKPSPLDEISAAIFAEEPEVDTKDNTSPDDNIDIDLTALFAADDDLPLPAQSSDNPKAKTTDSQTRIDLTSDDLSSNAKVSQPVSLSADDDDWSKAFTGNDTSSASSDLNNPQSYDNAILKIRDALNSQEQVSLDDVQENPVSLTPQEDSLSQAFADFADTAKVIASDETADGSWQYQSSSQENPEDNAWEYVDEQGNPVSEDDGEWEYVDENGNPITPSDDDEWEYVDENGNPITPSDDDEWEYVDENGNVVNH